MQYPRLPLASERELVCAAQAGDCQARDELIEAFMPLVGGMARIYRATPVVNRDELMQEGVVGLLRALRRFDLELGPPFWAYASWWVRQAMQQLVSELARPVVLSDRAVRQLARVRDARRTYVQSQGRDATTDELSTECGLPRRQVEKLLAAERDPRALDEPIGGEGGGMCTFGDQLADPQAEEEYDRLPWRLEEQHVLALLDGLTTREQAILHGRFGLGCPERTLRELADRFGVSAERVRQIEERALARLRDAVDGEQGRPISAG